MKAAMAEAADETFSEFRHEVERDTVVLGGGFAEHHHHHSSSSGVGTGSSHHSSIPSNASMHPLSAYLVHYFRTLQGHSNAFKILFGSETTAVSKTISAMFNHVFQNLSNKVQAQSHFDSSAVSQLGHHSRSSGAVSVGR